MRDKVLTSRNEEWESGKYMKRKEKLLALEFAVDIWSKIILKMKKYICVNKETKAASKYFLAISVV